MSGSPHCFMPTSPQITLTDAPWLLEELWPTFYKATNWPLLCRGSITPIDIHELSPVPTSPTIILASRRATTELSSVAATLSSGWDRWP